MSELRFDNSTADWVVFAPLRKLRPHTSHANAQSSLEPTPVTHVTSCPFCPGNESMTPFEIDVIMDQATHTWRTRVIPNKFPALQIEESDHRVLQGEFYQSMGGCGAHEVVIESPHHDLFLAQQSIDQIEAVLTILQRRFHDLARDSRFQSIVIFKNHGERAGTSLRHPHWQIIATPVVPRTLRLRYDEAIRYFDRYGESLYEKILDEELAAGERIVAVNTEFVAFLPFASHMPFECWIMPRQPQTHFGAMTSDQTTCLAYMLRDILLKLYVGLENPDFNLTIDTAFGHHEHQFGFRWHVRILPRLCTTAGFELGSGMSINTVLPEDAASFLRGGDVVEEQRSL